MDASFDYSSWTGAELERAESTAHEFLSTNHAAICQSFARQAAVIEKLIAYLKRTDLSADERLDCFARIAEASEAMHDCANGFFDLASQPLVARLLAKPDPS